MKRVLRFPLYALGMLAVPMVSFAAEEMYMWSFFIIETLPIAVAIVFGLIASITVLQAAQKIQGGILASVYRDFGLGMLLIVLGFSVRAASDLTSPFLFERFHDLFFVIGFALMAYGSTKLLHRAGL